MSTEIIQNILVKKTTKPVSFCDRWRLCQWTDAPLFWHHCSFLTLVLNWVLSESAWPPERLDRTCCGDNCSISEFDVHHCVTPNEKYGFITKNFVTATAEYRCFISGLSHHPCSTFKSIVFGEAIRMRRLNEHDEDYQSALVRLRNKALRSGFSQNMVKTW